VDPIALHPPLFELKKIIITVLLLKAAVLVTSVTHKFTDDLLVFVFTQKYWKIM
jgi:hypothetical protein